MYTGAADKNILILCAGQGIFLSSGTEKEGEFP
jgi:hypothetical protein